ncbi:MAG: DNA-directed RNA polymerase subunit beta [Alphaproteobacteria bacterium]|nr:DNA-directed RNA polymerase subunit beta [Alphaproteobacteria bacterium]
MKGFMNSKSQIRKSFGKIDLVASIPDLLELQKFSYDNTFLQIDSDPHARKNIGLESVFKSIFPIMDPSSLSTLDYVKYEFDEPKYDVDECRQRGMSFAAPLKATLRLIVWEVDPETDAREIKGIKEQEVYMGDIPLMTKSGTFIINGTERVVVSQMHRSPGVFFDHDEGKNHSSGKYLYSARIIPYRGSWLDLEFDAKDLLYFRIDRKRKFYVSTLLRALGMKTQEIYDYFYTDTTFDRSGTIWKTTLKPELFGSQRLNNDMVDASTGKIIAEAGTKLTPRIIKKFIQEGVREILVLPEYLIGKYLAQDLIDKSTGEVFVSVGTEISDDILTAIDKLSISQIKVLNISSNMGPYIRNTIVHDKITDREQALVDIFRVLRPGEPATLETAQNLFESLFFDPVRYDLSEVGRIKLNSKLNLDVPIETCVLTKEDIKRVVKSIVELKDGKSQIDDIDHLGNRRVRSVGELIENQFRVGLVRLEKSIIERMGVVSIDTVMPHDLVNSKSLTTIVKEFFSSSQLSQFMDQTNPLSEVTHKRRLSALGPGGLSRDRAGFEVRDVHTTHYGRICPIETPEGQNIGLINSLATYARINKYGFIESPYRKVKDGVITDEVVYLSAIDEDKYKIAQAKIERDAKGKIIGELINCRFNSDFTMVPPNQVDFLDVTPMQVVSVAASLIPFLENDDANRALMGSNMQRQAVPLLRAEAPVVGTGIEKVVAKDSGAVVIAINDGIVDQVDSTRIVIRTSAAKKDGAPEVDIYNLQKFQRSNHNTCINQKPLVAVGDKIKFGDVIADGPSTENGEIALGRNVLVAFIPWSGYNFEDSILISEKIAKNDVFTSVHIEEFELIARDTRLGPEEITRDIPNVSDECLSHLDEVGIVHVGADVRPGDILVGKVTPKSESPMTPEEKLLRAIFGEKAGDVRDSSLHVPPGVQGTVVEVRVFSRRGVEKDERALAIEQMQIEKLAKDRDDQIAIIERFVFIKLESLLLGQEVISGPKSIKVGEIITNDLLNKLSKGQYWQVCVNNAEIMSEIEQIKRSYDDTRDGLNKTFHSKVDKLQSGDDLPQGALKVVKVFIASKHKLQPGDKMAGRHGNKGVISRILPEEDMPFLEDGTVVDVVLNPLGLPSRMNVGQILETHLGWAGFNLGKQLEKMAEDYRDKNGDIEEARTLLSKIFESSNEMVSKLDSISKEELMNFALSCKKGIRFATPVFDGAKISDVKHMLELANVCTSGQTRLIDGRTGEFFDRDVTVGYKYLLKLHHLVDDKIHARSIGPYSLVTQQPLGGKSRFGGQRFGEMECWALQAYGAAYTLQEMLTVKSDDVTGRIKIYESIVRGDNNFESSIPESFNVMIKEFRSLCLNIQLDNDETTKDKV